MNVCCCCSASLHYWYLRIKCQRFMPPSAVVQPWAQTATGCKPEFQTVAHCCAQCRCLLRRPQLPVFTRRNFAVRKQYLYPRKLFCFSPQLLWQKSPSAFARSRSLDSRVFPADRVKSRWWMNSVLQLDLKRRKLNYKCFRYHYFLKWTAPCNISIRHNC